MKAANRVIEGLTVVALGLIFLGSTLGYLSWSVVATFFALLSLWPVLLVSVGLDIIGRSLNADWLRLLSSAVVLVGVLVGGLVLPASDVNLRWFPFYDSLNKSASSTPFSFEQPRWKITSGAITINGGAGNIEVADGPEDVLVSMNGTSPFDNPTLSVEKTSGSAVDVLASMGEGPTFWPLGGTSEMRVQLSPAVRWGVTLETGAASMNADLQRVPITSLALKTGASDSTVILGGIPPGLSDVPVELKAGVASVVLKLPKGVPARVESHSGLATLSVPDGYVRADSGDGRVYTSPNWAEGVAGYSVLVETGVGSVRVEEY